MRKKGLSFPRSKASKKADRVAVTALSACPLPPRARAWPAPPRGERRDRLPWRVNELMSTAAVAEITALAVMRAMSRGWRGQDGLWRERSQTI